MLSEELMGAWNIPTVELSSFMVLVLSATPSQEHWDKNNNSQTDAWQLVYNTRRIKEKKLSFHWKWHPESNMPHVFHVWLTKEDNSVAKEYYEMSLVGEHIHCLTTRSTDIWSNQDRRTHACIKPHGTFTWQGFNKFDHGPHVGVDGGLRFCMRRDDPDYDSKRRTIAKFGSAVKWFAAKYREYFSNDATLKVHYLKTYLNEELISHKR